MATSPFGDSLNHYEELERYVSKLYRERKHTSLYPHAREMVNQRTQTIYRRRESGPDNMGLTGEQEE
jgi:hypothetical protein